MPEYLAPGVFVEETSFRQKSIEGVSTSTTAFIGPTRTGPVFGPPPLLTSFLDFERVYGGIDTLRPGGREQPNYLAHAVRAFFDEGGRRLYCARTYLQPAEDEDGRAAADVGQLGLRARHPGRAGDFTVTFRFALGRNVHREETDDQNQTVSRLGAATGDTVLVVGGNSPGLFWVDEDPADPDARRLRQDAIDAPNPTITELDQLGGATATVHVVTITVEIDGLGRFVDGLSWENLTPHNDPFRRDSLRRVFAAAAATRAAELHVPLIIDEVENLTGNEIVDQLLGQDAATRLEELLAGPQDDQDGIPRLPRVEESVTLSGGNDGQLPGAGTYHGREEDGLKSGFEALKDVDDISIVAAPGSTAPAFVDANLIIGIQRELVGHCERLRYRVAVLDCQAEQTVQQVREYRAGFDSKYGALYYPWVRVFDPLTRAELDVPPSGHLAGIWGRNDVQRGVHKAPANEVVRSALDFELRINRAQQEVLNPEGINCLRYLKGRGFRVWGARTISSDPEWKYVSTRRLFVYLERSIDVSTQWAVFEPNGEDLWANVRRTVEDFLYSEWTSGRLAGTTEDEAYFVKCDRSTMTQNDLDNGRMICLIGVAPLYPAEFVIFRIGQKTLESRGPGEL